MLNNLMPNSAVIGDSNNRLPIILLHGLFGTGDSLLQLARAMAEDFQVFRLDLRNHGRSPWAKTMSLSEMASDIVAFMDAQGINKAFLVGHSLGGKVAMQLALEQPQRVAKLVVADIAPVSYRGNHDDVLAGLKSVDLKTLQSRREADGLMKEFVDEDTVRLFVLKNLYRNTAGEFAWRINIDAIERCYPQLAEGNYADAPYDGPTLFIKGQESGYIRDSHSDAIDALFTDVRLKIIQGAGHLLHVEKPQIFNALVKRFLLESLD